MTASSILVSRCSSSTGRESLPAARDRDRAGLFRNDEHDGVGLLGQAERRAMARAEARMRQRLFGERQKASRRLDAALAHDHRAVVQGRRGREEREQQLLREIGVEGSSAFRR